jgi:imidazolonepropionase-like amidohydrolase
MLASLLTFSLTLVPFFGNTDEPLEGAFFIQGVHLAAADGTTSGPHDVFIAHGFITAISPSGTMDAPADSHQIQVPAGETWLVYPGFLHANWKGSFSDSTQPYGGEISDPTMGPIPAMELGNHQSLRGWERATDRLEWSPKKGDAWRGLGFAAVQVIPEKGLVRGNSSWVSLNGMPLGEATLNAQGAFTYSLKPANEGYPRTAMAALATLRQAMLDAQQNGRLSNPALAALKTHGTRIYLANSAREIRNVLDLQQEFGKGEPITILGGKQAWRLAARLADAKVGVVYTLDLPKELKEEKEIALEKRPWWQTPPRLRAEQQREMAEQVGAFQVLLEKGVRCALAPGDSAEKFAKDLKRLAENGMTADALRAALGPALGELLEGMTQRPIEVGAPADFFIHQGPWVPGDSKITWAFVAGRGWEIDLDEETTTKAKGFLNGKWKISLDTPMGKREFGIQINTKKSKVWMFDLENQEDKEEVADLEFNDARVRFTFQPPDMPMDFEADLTFNKDGSGSGTLSSHFGDMDCDVKRISTPEDGELEEVDPPSEKEDTPSKEDPSEGVKEGAEEETESKQTDLGHPAWPVEIEGDRNPSLHLNGDVFFQGATLYPMTGVEPYLGDILILKGKIAAVGRNVEIPNQVPVVDASSWHITPAILDAHSHLALDSINEGSVAISAECRVGDMIRPHDVGIWRAAAGGTAVVQSLHGSANPIGGQAAVWELDYFQADPSLLLYPGAKQGIKFALGENVKQSNWESSWGKRFPNSRVGVQAVFRRAFTAAEDYLRQRAAFEKGDLPSFRRDVRLETLAAILEGDIHIQCHSYRADELLMFLGICKEFGIKNPTFQHVLEGYKVAPELAAYGAMASTFSDWWAYKFEVRDAIPWNVALLHAAGVTVSINSDSDEMIRRLNTEAGKAMRYGRLSWEEALATATLNSAKQLWLEDRLGSLEVGKDGTLSVWDSPPLTHQARCQMTVARGRLLFQFSPQVDLQWETYQTEVAQWAADHSQVHPSPKEAKPMPAAWTKNGQGHAYFIRNAFIHPISSSPFEGMVLVVDGTIQWMGQIYDGPIPSYTIDVDAGGMHLYPGFINGADRTGLFEIAAVRASRDDIEIGKFQPDLSFATAIHADSDHHDVTRLSGTTHMVVRGDRGTISGQAALIQLDGDTTQDMVVQADIGLVIRFPRTKPSKDSKEPEEPKGLEELNQWFDDALAYGKRQARIGGGPLNQRDLRLAALVPYAQGAKPIFLEAENAASIMAARQWAAEKELQVVWMGVRDAWKVAGLLGADGAKVVIGQVHRLPGGKNDPFDSPFRNAAVLKAAGCEIAFRTNDPEIARNLPFQAATARAWGLGNEATLHALTLGAAKIFGVDAYTGSIEIGKAANFFLAEGDPLEFEGHIRRMWIGGKEVPLKSHQTELRDRYRERIQDQAGR